MSYPFTQLPIAWQQGFFLSLLVLTLLVMTRLARLERPLKEAGAGIVAFELAGTQERAQAIMAGWGAVNCQRAPRQTYLDFVFLVLYSLTLALGCGLAARAFAPGSGLTTLGPYLAWAQVDDGLLDVLENVALIRLLRGSQSASLPHIARGCAPPKFAIAGLGVAYVLNDGLTWLAQ